MSGVFICYQIKTIAVIYFVAINKKAIVFSILIFMFLITIQEGKDFERNSSKYWPK
jgi:hypothetical protein